MRRVIGLCLLLLSASAWTEVTQFGQYQVHHSVFTTDFLLPEVAVAYGITRAADKAMINISVRQVQPDGGDLATKGEVAGTVSDLVHRTPLAFREIVEQDALYYIADFDFINEETLYFEIDIVPEGQRSTLKVKFNQKLYVD